MPRTTRRTEIPDHGSKSGATSRKTTIVKEEPSSRSPPVEHSSQVSPMPSFPSPSLSSQSLRMSYAIARGEQGVLTFEPYKSILIPHWRFRTVPIAEESSKTLKGAFDLYVRSEDFVGADMARKFIQMGMTRARRYANHKGGKKYNKSERELERDGGERKVLPKSEGHEGMEEKAAASEVFKEVWRACIQDAAYLILKEDWKKEKAQWEKSGKRFIKEEHGRVQRKGETTEVDVKKEEDV